jgi:hypothetical protein
LSRFHRARGQAAETASLSAGEAQVPPATVPRRASGNFEQFCGSIVLSLMESPVNRKQVVGSLLMKARKYRDFARWVGDWETAQRIMALAEELKNRARALARPDERRIRKRAREIWEENGRPAGRDEEFWLQAEREFREAEELTRETRDET